MKNEINPSALEAAKQIERLKEWRSKQSPRIQHALRYDMDLQSLLESLSPPSPSEQGKSIEGSALPTLSVVTVGGRNMEELMASIGSTFPAAPTNSASPGDEIEELTRYIRAYSTDPEQMNQSDKSEFARSIISLHASGLAIYLMEAGFRRSPKTERTPTCAHCGKVCTADQRVIHVDNCSGDQP